MATKRNTKRNAWLFGLSFLLAIIFGATYYQRGLETSLRMAVYRLIAPGPGRLAFKDEEGRDCFETAKSVSTNNRPIVRLLDFAVDAHGRLRDHRGHGSPVSIVTIRTIRWRRWNTFEVQADFYSGLGGGSETIYTFHRVEGEWEVAKSRTIWAS